LENQRLPQRVRLFKFLEGDLQLQINLLDRQRRDDNRDRWPYSPIMPGNKSSGMTF